MVSKKLDLQPMGAFAAAIEEKDKALKAREAALRRQEVEEACCECGAHGAHGDGEFYYCAEHLPPDFYATRDAAHAFTAQMHAQGTPWPPRDNNYRPSKES